MSQSSGISSTLGRQLAVLLCALIAAISCQRERASVEELYTTRMLALGFLQRNQLAEAEAEFQKLIRLAPDDPFAYANLGLAYLQAGRYDDAEKQLDRAHELEPNNADVDLALARLYSLTKRESEARKTLERLRAASPANARVLYALAEMDAGAADAASRKRYEDRLRDVLGVSPANLAVRFDLVSAFAMRGDLDSAVRHLEEVRRIPPELPVEVRIYVDSAIQLLRAGSVEQSRSMLRQLRERIEVTAPYQASLADVKWTEGPLVGRPILSFAPKGFVSRTGVRETAATDVTRFVDATAEVGLSNDKTAFTTGDIDGDGDDDVFARGRFYRIQNGSVRDSSERIVSGTSFATLADYDNDGWLDLLTIAADGSSRLFWNRGNATFEDVNGKASIGNLAQARKAVFVDLDHDGDLDILVIGAGPCKIFRNNLDGTFTESAAAFGFQSIHDIRDADIGDFDSDGRIDVAVAADNDVLMLNRGAQRFAASSAAGLSGMGSSAVVTGDYDNDGFLDVLRVGKSGLSLWRNRGNGTFDRRAAISSPNASTAAFVDYDNDGWTDILAVGSSGVSLSRNDGTGKFVDRSSIIPDNVRSRGFTSIVISDVDGDGDEDFWLSDASGSLELLRNNGGNSNLAVNIELKALRTGSGKNNTLGIGAKLVLRAGSIYQTRVAASRVTHFGLGPHLKADVLRVEWPNGVPQTVYFPGADQDVVESETLKGSCALAYTWDGKQFRFGTDAMWRSALGMPLGLMGGTSAFAPAGASQEYLRIDGDALKPRNGRYLLQLTEELWETAYADQVQLIAADHPDSVDIFVDERFVPPGPVNLNVFQVPQAELPLSAVDERGQNVLDALREVDDNYVSNFIPTRYQGVVEPHDLIMDLGPDAGRPGTALFLRGWIYPTDASINVALSQQSTISISSPSLEVRDARGKWRTAVPNIGFPSGKDKTLIIDLSGKFPTSDHHVRIRTNMQIYWDKAFVGKTIADKSIRITKLDPVAADLHYRGFSRMYRKGGRYGPYWFAYDDVTKTSPWRPIEGKFTRFGDVLSLLKNPDDMYVVMGPGDEATIQFDATSASSVPKGWKRDFLLYTDGWIKDSDLNTAHGATVEPLPYHDLRSYPYGGGEKYPTDAQHQNYLRTYNTRSVSVNSNVVH